MWSDNTGKHDCGNPYVGTPEAPGRVVTILPHNHPDILADTTTGGTVPLGMLWFWDRDFAKDI